MFFKKYPGPQLGVDGFTVFTESPTGTGEGSGYSGNGTRKVYVSNSTGSDANTGTQASPKQTIAGGLAITRDQKPDWLLFKRGDTWTDERFGIVSQPSNGTCKRGVSATEPMLFGAYGTGARPLIKTHRGASAMSTPGGGGGAGCDYLAIVGLNLQCYTRDPDDDDFDPTGLLVNNLGLDFVLPQPNWFLLEDCKIGFYAGNVGWNTTPAGLIRIRRNIIHNSYVPEGGAHSQGLAGQSWKAMIIEENFIYHNGWNEDVTDGEADDTNHNCYLQVHVPSLDGGGSPVGMQAPLIYRNNISALGSSHGVTVNSGGTIENNLLVGNAIGAIGGDGAFDIDGSAGVNSHRHNAAYVKFNRNVILHGRDISIAEQRGGGFNFNSCEGGEARENIIAHCDVSGTNVSGIDATTQGAGNVINMYDNIMYNWDSASGVCYGVALGADENNHHSLDGNDPEEVPYPDPGRTLARYDDEVLGGPGTREHFYEECLNRAGGEWPEELTANAVNNWIRAGFGR